MQIGTLTKGGISLPVYRCARGSTSLESFHLHLDHFIPGTSSSARYFQAFLVDGMVRWNEDCAAAAAPADAAETRTSLHSYCGHLKHALNQKSQWVLGHQMVEDFTKPASYTGELIGLEYLFRQTGSVFEEINLDPDAPDEGAAVSTLEDEDEGIQSDEGDPTIFPPDSSSSSSSSSSMAASQSGAPRSESPPSSPEVSGSQAPPLQNSSECVTSAVQPLSGHWTACRREKHHQVSIYKSPVASDFFGITKFQKNTVVKVESYLYVSTAGNRQL
ncbi:uncharacterized protein LOC124866285 [Girardinichthys multiradiatus]|uniref:uncharacterized protein LOC124866285 n=1 Tax=Girardinichthys multiradiatus TaxID=208333 RepID=UPI001FAE26FB|nr:uncharacterized protein LOC124866285 [Girardinichthys multiradiatus]